MKKILIALLVVTMASSVMIAGCSNKSEDKNTSSGNSIASEESSSLSESSTEDSSSSFDSDSSKSESISSDSNEATDGDLYGKTVSILQIYQKKVLRKRK